MLPEGVPPSPTDTNFYSTLAEELGSAAAFKFNPSVGTWLKPKHHALQVGAAILSTALSKLNRKSIFDAPELAGLFDVPEEAVTQAVEIPQPIKPSVGTWKLARSTLQATASTAFADTTLLDVTGLPDLDETQYLPSTSLLKPSTATWTLPLPLKTPERAAAATASPLAAIAAAIEFDLAPWNRRPSTGTWLGQKSLRQPTKVDETVSKAEPFQGPFFKRPSCGTWLLLKPEDGDESEQIRGSDNAAVTSYMMTPCIPRLMLDEIPCSQATSPMVTGAARLQTPSFRAPLADSELVATVASQFVAGPSTLAMLSTDIQIAVGGTAVADAIALEEASPLGSLVFQSPPGEKSSSPLTGAQIAKAGSYTSAQSAGTWVSEKLSEAASAGHHATLARIEFNLENIDFDLLMARQQVYGELKRQLAACVSDRLQVRANTIAVQFSRDALLVDMGIFCSSSSSADRLKASIDDDRDGFIEDLKMYASRVPGIEECCKFPGGVGASRLVSGCSLVASVGPSVSYGSGYVEFAKGITKGVLTEAEASLQASQVLAAGSTSQWSGTLSVAEFEEQMKQGEVVQARCPPDTKAGDKIIVVIPQTGEKLIVEVPAGIASGEAFAVVTPKLLPFDSLASDIVPEGPLSGRQLDPSSTAALKRAEIAEKAAGKRAADAKKRKAIAASAEAKADKLAEVATSKDASDDDIAAAMKATQEASDAKSKADTASVAYVTAKAAADAAKEVVQKALEANRRLILPQQLSPRLKGLQKKLALKMQLPWTRPLPKKLCRTPLRRGQKLMQQPQLRP
jgi:hypothetical protein